MAAAKATCRVASNSYDAAMSAPRPASSLDRPTLLDALGRLSERLAARGVEGEICLFGGTAMLLAYAARLSTRDVDAIFEPASVIREEAAVIGTSLGLPTDWLNDGVKGFVSKRHEVVTGNLPQFPNLRVTMPVPEYLLAMKAMASRVGGTAGEPSDVADVRLLIEHLGLPSAASVLEVVRRYYPDARVPVKAQYLVEGLFEEKSP